MLSIPSSVEGIFLKSVGAVFLCSPNGNAFTIVRIVVEELALFACIFMERLHAKFCARVCVNDICKTKSLLIATTLGSLHDDITIKGLSYISIYNNTTVWCS